MSDVMGKDDARKSAASVVKINPEVRCLAGGSHHHFVFLGQTTDDDAKTYDVFFCRKCLIHYRVEVPKPQEHRG